MIVRTFVSHIWLYLLPFQNNLKECLQLLLEVEWNLKFFQFLFAGQPVLLQLRTLVAYITNKDIRTWGHGDKLMKGHKDIMRRSSDGFSADLSIYLPDATCHTSHCNLKKITDTAQVMEREKTREKRYALGRLSLTTCWRGANPWRRAITNISRACLTWMIDMGENILFDVSSWTLNINKKHKT